MKKIYSILLGTLFTAVCAGSAMAAQSTSSSADISQNVAAKAGDSVVTLKNGTVYEWDVLATFRPTGAQDFRHFYARPYGRDYFIRYPDQLVCFQVSGHDLGCYSSGTYYITVKQANDKNSVAISTSAE